MLKGGVSEFNLIWTTSTGQNQPKYEYHVSRASRNSVDKKVYTLKMCLNFGSSNQINKIKSPHEFMGNNLH